MKDKTEEKKDMQLLLCNIEKVHERNKQLNLV